MTTKNKKKQSPIFIAANHDGVVDIVVRSGQKRIGDYKLRQGEQLKVRVGASSGGGDTASPSRKP
jgi:hypothetical protein